MKNPTLKIAAIGGGTGLSTMLKGIKAYTDDITAVVTAADDGGGSGTLRQDLGILPPGDIRNCLVALAETEPVMTELFQHRFREGSLAGQTFGNLFLAAMYGISDGVEEALQKVGGILRVTGKVLPVTGENVNISALLENGEEILGESNIGSAIAHKKSRILSVSMIPANAPPLPAVIESLEQADIIILGPGSLYTSIVPNIIVGGVAEAISASGAMKVYVCNIMSQPGETDGMTAYEHAAAVCRHAKGRIMDFCIVNGQEIPNTLLEKYIDDGSVPVEIGSPVAELDGVEFIQDSLVSIKDGLLRHDYDRLAEIIFDMYDYRQRTRKVTMLR